MKKHYEEISDEELRALTGAIHSRYGIDFRQYESKSLKRGFARLIGKHQLESLIGLWGRILRDREFFISCIDDLTVNLTELFRNPDFWSKLHDDILPDYKSSSTLKIWHAGCSTGEEVYSMAVVLGELHLLSKTDTWATDLSSRALAKAMKAEYPGVLLRKYEQSLSKYLPHREMEHLFRMNDRGMTIREQFKKHIRFQQHNLVQDDVNETFDIIFCRNVMIYFDEKLKVQVLQKLHKALKSDGYLIIGYYDMLPEEGKTLFELYDSKTRIYKRKQTL